ncbi:MAG: hypothetical protein M1827_001730 [Pycnora praestabilis]|nr:MAG: hypothetical protein M1827_001730 [Pycnora praestabilis]
MEKDIELGSANQSSNVTPQPTMDAIQPTAFRMTLEHEDAGNDLSFRAVDPVDVRIRNLSVSVDITSVGAASLFARFSRKRRKVGGESGSQMKTILNDVSADMPTGALTAIIGGSGSGKTSMLNIMSERMHGSRLQLSGTTSYNGHAELSNVRSAYVMQQDVLLPTLTVRETLQYSADLRLPPPTTQEERRRVVDEVIMELGLKECANTKIGNHAHKGCSGGEKRRTSIGVQLLANPSVLFLDEPTTGLDATSAFQLVRTLKNLAQKGRTVITTIHQPRSEIWGLFDGLILLTRGAPVYSGSATACLPYFEALGYKLPAFVNPAEFLIDAAAVDTRSPQLEEQSLVRVNGLKDAWRARSSENFSNDIVRKVSANAKRKSKKSLSAIASALTRQTRVLTARTFKVTYRDPMGMAGSLIEAVSMGVLTGWIFFALPGSLAGIRSREGALYVASSLQGYLILLFETYRLTVDIELFDRERGEGVVGIIPFLISRRLARIFIEDVPVPLLFSIIFYFMVGFRADAAQFFNFFAIILLGQYIAISFATLCVAVSRNFPGASLVANMGYTLQSLACGYFIQSNTIPVYVRWLKWAAYNFYAFSALCTNEFVGHFYDCPVSGGSANPACKEYTGAYIMNQLGFPTNWTTWPVCVLLAFAVALYIGAGVIFRFWKVGMSISQVRVNDTDYSAGKEKMTTRSHHEIRTVDIGLEGYGLDIDKRNSLGRRIPTLSILKPVTATFESGVLNIIMGPSGSGKTSLLNSMARRLHSTFATKYKFFGKMTINGAVPSESVITSICSYVSQDDDALLPSLTVRETLHFAAGLRLPSWMSSEEKIQRAESVLLKLGLRDCADNLVGSELVKGISGGEKRRVTIAVQVLTDPRVLLLDEPTSGLDAFTASSIIDVLRGLAEEGRTLIMTIHQSRSDLFQHFGNVLLLARGGSPVYAGKGSAMLSHFSSLGYSCPTTTNPADFALDLITVDLQQDAKEAASREKVRGLVSSWDTEQASHITAPPEKSEISTPAELGGLMRHMAPFRISYPLLVQRGIINFRRQPNLLLARIMQVFSFGIILTLFFAPLKSDYYSVQNRLGFIQEFTALYFVGMLQNVAIYPVEKAVFEREYDDRAYSVEAFFLQYLTNEVPFEIITALLFAVLVVMAAGLPRTATMLFVTAFNAFCIVSCGESLGIVFNTIFNHTGFAVNVISVILSLATLMAGVVSLQVPTFLSAFNHLSPLLWSLGNLAPYSLRDQKFTCTDYQRLANGQCPINTGQDVLILYGLNKNAGLNLLALGLCAIIYRGVAYLLLKAMKTHWRSLFEKDG